MNNIVIAALYRFFDFPHFEQMRAPLLEQMNGLCIRGSILITPEGINGTVSGTRENMDALLAYLREHIVKGDFEHKESPCTYQPFSRTKVRLKKETISIGESAPLSSVGTYVDAKEWNELISDPETLVLDTRNNYEVHLGTFERAVNPGIRTFKKLPAYVRKHLDPVKDKTKKIATFCTGGIRCEKFTAWMREQGYENVYHLKGGILKYLEEIPEKESRWRGECYVFDERIAVSHGLKPAANVGRCEACDHTLTIKEMEHSAYIRGEQCPHCVDNISNRKRRFRAGKNQTSRLSGDRPEQSA